MKGIILSAEFLQNILKANAIYTPRKPEFHSYSKGITRQKTVILQFNPDRHDGSFLLVLWAETNALSLTSVRIYFSPLHVEAVKKNHA